MASTIKMQLLKKQKVQARHKKNTTGRYGTPRKSCPAFNKKYEKCGRKGHLASKCFTKGKKTSSDPEIKVEAVKDASENEEEMYIIAVTKNEDYKKDWQQRIFATKLGSTCSVQRITFIYSEKKVGGIIKKTVVRKTFTDNRLSVIGETMLTWTVKDMK